MDILMLEAIIRKNTLKLRCNPQLSVCFFTMNDLI